MFYIDERMKPRWKFRWGGGYENAVPSSLLKASLKLELTDAEIIIIIISIVHAGM